MNNNLQETNQKQFWFKKFTKLLLSFSITTLLAIPTFLGTYYLNQYLPSRKEFILSAALTADKLQELRNYDFRIAIISSIITFICFFNYVFYYLSMEEKHELEIKGLRESFKKNNEKI